MLLDVQHDIRFTYDDFICESFVELRLEPQTNLSQTVHSFYLAVGPRTKVSRYVDWSGNSVRHFSIANYHKNIEVRARSVVETKPPRVLLSSVGEAVRRKSELGSVLDYLSFDGPITDSSALRTLVKSVGLDPHQPIGQQVEMIGQRVKEAITYRKNVTAYNSKIDEALKYEAGVCQDFAQIMIGMLRLVGIPARYVSGYLHLPDSNTDSESHAWVEFYSKEYGWVSYDPTGGVQPGEKHVVVGTARHNDEVPPNKGVYRGMASENMVATVRTSEVAAPTFSLLREEIQDIELPVYAETPPRHLIGAPDEQEAQESQQQQ